MLVYFTGLVFGIFGTLARRVAAPLGIFRDPDPDEPSLWRQVVRGLGWLAVATAYLLWLYLILSALTADNVIGREGILGRILDSLDGFARGLFDLIGRFIPDIEVSL